MNTGVSQMVVVESYFCYSRSLCCTLHVPPCSSLTPDSLFILTGGWRGVEHCWSHSVKLLYPFFWCTFLYPFTWYIHQVKSLPHSASSVFFLCFCLTAVLEAGDNERCQSLHFQGLYPFSFIMSVACWVHPSSSLLYAVTAMLFP